MGRAVLKKVSELDAGSGKIIFLAMDLPAAF
jgi:hypothetical protein